MKVLGYYVVKDGHQIAWFRLKRQAIEYANARNAKIVPEFEERRT